MNLEPIKARREALTALNIKDFYAHAPTDIAELVAEVERLRAVIEGEQTTKPTHRGAVTGCTNRAHLHLADAQAALAKASRCTFGAE